MQSQVYRTKVSPYISIPVALLIIGLLGYIFMRRELSDLVVAIPIFAFLAHMYLTTAYTITGTRLHVKSGFLVNETIDIYKITAIAETHTMLGAPALSMDRIEIFYERYDSIVISPPDKVEFIAALKIINPDIEVRLAEKAI